MHISVKAALIAVTGISVYQAVTVKDDDSDASAGEVVKGSIAALVVTAALGAIAYYTEDK